MARMMAPIASVLLLSLVTGCDGDAASMPPPPRPDAAATLAGQVKTVIEAQLAAIDAEPSKTEARAMLARTYQANGMPGLSVGTWQQLLDVTPGNAEYWYSMALAHHQLAALDDAITAAATARSLAPQVGHLWWRPAIWELEQGRPEAARMLAREAVDRSPDNAGGYVALARALLDLNRADEAIVVLETLKAMTPHPHINYLLGQAYQRTGRAERAQSFFTQGSPQQPGFPDPWQQRVLDAQRGLDAALARVDRLLEEDQLDAAAHVLQEAMVQWPGEVNLIHRRSEIYRRRGDANRWLLELRKALAIEPENAATHLNLSLAYRQLDKRSQALNHALTAIGYNPSIPAAHLQLARLNLMDDNAAEAVLSLDKAFQLGVTDSRERLQYAHVLLRVGRFDESESQAKRVVDANPANPLAWGVLAEARDAQGRTREALATLEQGLEIVPGNDALLMLQQRFLQRGSTSGRTGPRGGQ